MALKQIKEANEKAIINYLKQGFGEGYEIKATWGYPVTQVSLIVDNEKTKVQWNINYNLDSEDFQLACLGEERVEKTTGEETGMVSKPNWATIDNNTINFITEGIKKVIDVLFSAPEENQKEAPEKVEKVEAEQVE
jgi:hypothetical protein